MESFNNLITVSGFIPFSCIKANSVNDTVCKVNPNNWEGSEITWKCKSPILKIAFPLTAVV